MKTLQFLSFFLAYMVIMISMPSCDDQTKKTDQADPIKIEAFTKPQPMVGLFVLSLEKHIMPPHIENMKMCGLK